MKINEVLYTIFLVTVCIYSSSPRQNNNSSNNSNIATTSSNSNRVALQSPKFQDKGLTIEPITPKIVRVHFPKDPNNSKQLSIHKDYD